MNSFDYLLGAPSTSLPTEEGLADLFPGCLNCTFSVSSFFSCESKNSFYMNILFA